MVRVDKGPPTYHYNADPIDHPFFGKVSRADYLRLQCMHFAHHLGFVIPTNGG